MEKLNDKLVLSGLNTGCQNTWCPGCGNFGIEIAVKKAFFELVDEGFVKRDDLVAVMGIGCHGKIADYINVNTFYSLHGRAIAPAAGIKMARPELAVIVMAGDGDAYGEGLDHLIFAAKRNVDMTVIIHDNRVYGLTAGQASPTSPLGFPGISTPDGSLDRPINPLELMLVAGATFIARAFSGDAESLRAIVKKAVMHKGLAFVEVLQPCFTYFDTSEYYRQHTYKLEAEYNPASLEAARERVREWDYSAAPEAKIPVGIFYQSEKPTFDRQLEEGGESGR